jgi:hypothetical protein
LFDMGLELFVDSALEAIPLLDNLTKLVFQKPNFLFTALNQLVRLSFIVFSKLDRRLLFAQLLAKLLRARFESLVFGLQRSRCVRA